MRQGDAIPSGPLSSYREASLTEIMMEGRYICAVYMMMKVPSRYHSIPRRKHFQSIFQSVRRSLKTSSTTYALAIPMSTNRWQLLGTMSLIHTRPSLARCCGDASSCSRTQDRLLPVLRRDANTSLLGLVPRVTPSPKTSFRRPTAVIAAT